MQGYNTQAATTTCQQLVVAAELTQDANDLQQLDPMLKATVATLAAAATSALDRRPRLLTGPGPSARRRRVL